MRARLNDKGVNDVSMAPGLSGQFDVTKEGAMLFSKKLMGRFPTDEEVDHWALTGQPEATFAKVIRPG